MHQPWHDAADIIGVIGCALLILAYFLLQAKKIASDSWVYLLMNLIAALLLLFSLLWSFNLGSFILELFWISISIYGIAKKRRTDYMPPINEDQL